MDLRQIRHTLLLVLAAFIWGSAFVAQSVGAEHMGAFTFLACRSWIGGAILLPVIAVLDRMSVRRMGTSRAPKDRKEKKTLLIAGLCCGAVLFSASAFQQIGVAYTTTAKAGFVTSMYVIIVPIASLLLGKRINGKIWLCAVLGVAGLYLLCMKDGFSLAWGDMMVLICAVLFSAHILVIDRFSPRVDGVRLSCLQFFITAILSTVCMIAFEKPSWEAVVQAAVPILYAGVLSSGVAYTLQIVGQKGVHPTVASLAMSLESVFSALCGWLILQQSLSWKEMAGCAVMFIAIILAQLPDRKKEM